MIAQEFLKQFSFSARCVFHTDEVEEKLFAGLALVPVNKVCGKPAVAVYVTADDQHEGQYVCAEHAHKAEREGDGPVFWTRPTPAEEGETGLRLTLAQE